MRKLKPKEQFSLGVRFKITGQSTKSPNRVRLEHKEEHHNKFYELELIPPTEIKPMSWSVQITYGRIGTFGSTTKETYTDEQLARKFFHRKLQEKIKKGYKRVI